MKYRYLLDIPRESICKDWESLVDAAIAADPQAPFLVLLRDENIPAKLRISGYAYQICKMDRPSGVRLALRLARIVEPLSTDPRVKSCNDATEAFLRGKMAKEDLIKYSTDVRAAAYDASTTNTANAAYAAYAADSRMIEQMLTEIETTYAEME